MANAADATLPDNVIYPPDVQPYLVNDVIVALAYNPDLLQFDPLSSDILKSTSADVNKSDRATQAHRTFMAELRKWMAKGYYVLLRQWHPHLRINWNVESVANFKASTNHTIEYQGMLRTLLVFPSSDHKQTLT